MHKKKTKALSSLPTDLGKATFQNSGEINKKHALNLFMTSSALHILRGHVLYILTSRLQWYECVRTLAPRGATWEVCRLRHSAHLLNTKYEPVCKSNLVKFRCVTYLTLTKFLQRFLPALAFHIGPRFHLDFSKFTDCLPKTTTRYFYQTFMKLKVEVRVTATTHLVNLLTKMYAI